MKIYLLQRIDYISYVRVSRYSRGVARAQWYTLHRAKFCVGQKLPINVGEGYICSHRLLSLLWAFCLIFWACRKISSYARKVIKTPQSAAQNEIFPTALFVRSPYLHTNKFGPMRQVLRKKHRAKTCNTTLGEQQAAPTRFKKWTVKLYLIRSKPWAEFHLCPFLNEYSQTQRIGVPLNMRWCFTRTLHGKLKGIKARVRTEKMLSQDVQLSFSCRYTIYHNQWESENTNFHKTLL